MYKFWFVWNENGNAPRHKHDTQHLATMEAERLARIHRGHTFIVLEAICARTVDDMKRVDLREYPDEPSIPF